MRLTEFQERQRLDENPAILLLPILGLIGVGGATLSKPKIEKWIKNNPAEAEKFSKEIKKVAPNPQNPQSITNPIGNAIVQSWNWLTGGSTQKDNVKKNNQYVPQPENYTTNKDGLLVNKNKKSIAPKVQYDQYISKYNTNQDGKFRGKIPPQLIGNIRSQGDAGKNWVKQYDELYKKRSQINKKIAADIKNGLTKQQLDQKYGDNLKNLNRNLNDHLGKVDDFSKGKKENTDAFCEAVKFLINKYFLTKIIEKEDIVSSVKKNIDLEASNIKSFKQLIKTPRKSVIARSQRQSDYIKALKESNIILSLGPAGTGKSFLAVSVAVTMLIEKKIERVILSRPAVEAGEKLGFLPGDMKEKVDPYLRPLYDALYELFGADKIDKKIETGEIEIAPLAFMRGRTLKNCFAILDEAQNATQTQIKMFLTRIGENSTLVVNGDPSQVDLINKSDSGLIESKKILKNLKEIKIIEFDHNDVVRHPLVSKIIRAYQNKSTDD